MSNRLALFVLAAISIALAAAPALGHEERKVGPLSITVGWAEEPAIAGLPNAVQVHVSHGDAPAHDDVELTAQVRFQSEEFGPLTLRPLPGTPGELRAPLIPTTPGAYVFIIAGKVGDTKVNQEFEPGPDTFAEVEGPSDLQFPEKAPTNAEVGRAITRLQGQLASARDQADGAQTQAKAAIVVGFIGLAIAGVALTRSRRKEAA
jgi:hypothetical protein